MIKAIKDWILGENSQRILVDSHVQSDKQKITSYRKKPPSVSNEMTVLDFHTSRRGTLVDCSYLHNETYE